MCNRYLCSLRSNCMKARVGAVLVKDHRIVSTGNALNHNRISVSFCLPTTTLPPASPVTPPCLFQATAAPRVPSSTAATVAARAVTQEQRRASTCTCVVSDFVPLLRAFFCAGSLVALLSPHGGFLWLKRACRFASVCTQKRIQSSKQDGIARLVPNALVPICFVFRPDFQPQALQYSARFSLAFNAQRKSSTPAFLR
jgi:hypothetical protein